LDVGQQLGENAIKAIAPVIGEAKRPRSSIRAESVLHHENDATRDANKQQESQAKFFLT